MTFSENGMSEFADGGFQNFPEDANIEGDIFKTIRGTENSKLANQKQAITILKATEAAIIEKGLPLEPKAYFEALFPLLDDEKRDVALKNDQNRIIEFNTAICYLLAFVFPRLDDEYLREIYADGGMIYGTLSHAMRRFHLIAPFVRSMCVVVGAVLAAHSGAADWKDEKSSLGELFVSLLGWSVDARPKVRRAAHDTLMKLLMGGGCPEAVEFTTEFVSSALLNATRKDPSAAIQLFPLLKQLLPKLNAGESQNSGVDNLVTGLLNCLNLGNTHLTCSGYEIIQSYAQEQVEAELIPGEESSWSSLGRIYGLVKRIGEGMMKGRPGVELADLSVAFLSALAQISLLTLRLQGLLEKDRTVTLQSALQMILGEYFMKSAEGKVLNAAGSAVLVIFFGLFDRMDAGKWNEGNVGLLQGTALPVLLAPEFGGLIVPQQGRLLQDAFVSLRLAAFLPVLARLIEILGDAAIGSLGPLILQVARLHDCRYLTCREDLVRVMGAVIRVSGLSETLKLIPLNLIRSHSMGVVEEAPKAWLLPVLRDSVYNTSLRSWLLELLPVAEKVGERAASFRSAEKIQEARVWETLAAQIFTILPSILSSFPTDFAETFPQLSELLARLLNDDAQLRPTLMAALQRFIHNSRSLLESLSFGGIDEVGLMRPLTLAQVEADLGALTGAMPQFLPILFNIYAATTRDDPSGDEDDSAAASSDLTLRLIETLLGLTEEGVVSEYFGKTVGRIERMRVSGSWGMLGTVLELAGTMIPYASTEALIKNFIPAVLPLLSVTDGAVSVQKKSYRVLGRALAREDVLAVYCREEGGRACEGLCATLMESADSVHSAAKRGRFRVLSLLAPELPDGALIYIPQLLPEVLLGVKEVNHRTRTCAYDLIVAWGRRMSGGGEFVGFDGSGRVASLREYISMVLAGLAGNTPHMISATIMALARVIFEFAAMLKASGDGSIVSTLTGDVATLLQSPSREIVKSAISFVKVALVVLDSETLSPLLAGLVSGLLLWSNVHHQQFKLQVRHLMERLVRRFGYERMEQVTPVDHHALLANIKKMRERKTRKQQAASKDEQGSATDNAETVSRAALSRASKKSQFLLGDEEQKVGSSNTLSNRARFEKALNDSESDNDYPDEDSDNDDDKGERGDKDHQGDKVSLALSRKMSAVSLKSVMSQRLPNMSRKQQDQLKRQMLVTANQSSGSQKRHRSSLNSDDEESGAEDEDVRFGSDGKLLIGPAVGEEERNISAVRDMDKIYRAAMTSFKRSADGKHVKFARGTKANFDEGDDDDDGSDGEGNNNRNNSKSMAAFSGNSRRTSLSTLSGRTSKSLTSTATTAKTSTSAHSGSQFRAKPGSRGDAKRKGAQFDPYAYVPIQRKGGKHGDQRKEDKYYMKNNKRARK